MNITNIIAVPFRHYSKTVAWLLDGGPPPHPATRARFIVEQDRREAALEAVRQEFGKPRLVSFYRFRERCYYWYVKGDHRPAKHMRPNPNVALHNWYAARMTP